MTDEHYHKETTSANIPGAHVTLESDYYNGERMDTHVKVYGDFWIAGNMIDEFIKALDEAIKKYRI